MFGVCLGRGMDNSSRKCRKVIRHSACINSRLFGTKGQLQLFLHFHLCTGCILSFVLSFITFSPTSIMRPTSRCWFGFFSVMALTISQTSALFVPNAADAVGAKNDHWRREPDSLVLAQPNLVIVQRDCSPELQSAAGQPIARDVWDPRITHPSASTVWERGSAVTVTW